MMKYAKKIRIAGTICFLICNSNLLSQVKNNNLKMGIGMFTIDQFADFKSGLLPENCERKNALSKGALFFSFSSNLSEKVASGASIGLDKVSSDIYIDGQLSGQLNRYLYTLALETGFIITSGEKTVFYSSIGGGYSLGQDKYSAISGEKTSKFISFMVFQLSPIGLRIGDQFAFFMEIGFGYKGVLHLGFSYNF